MNDREQYKRIILFFLSIVNLTALSAIFGYVWYEFYSEVIVQPFFRRGNWLVIAIYALLMVSFTRLYGGYKIGYLKRGDAIYSQILSVVFVNTLTYLQISLIGRRFMDLKAIAVMTAVDMALIPAWVFLADGIYRRLYPPRKMLLVYGYRLPELLIDKMGSRSEKYDICEAVSIADGLPAVLERICEYKAVVICDVKSGLRNKILKYCFKNSIRTYMAPNISDIIVRSADANHLFDSPLLLCRNQGLSFEQRLAKRILDILLSVFGIVVFSPVMLLIAAAIKLYDGGPVLYRQKRLTIDGGEFDIYKFRSMVVDAEKDTGERLAAEHDERITPVGSILRKIRFDEIPQLFNILKGEMSVVGPRPERPEIAWQYEQDMPEFSFRLKVKAGLTGYAQVLGKYNTTPYDKLKLDLTYIGNYSILLDFKLILMTIKILFIKESTEGVARESVPVQSAGKGKGKKEKEMIV